MSDDAKATATAKEPGRPSAMRLVNPTVRDYMEALSLQRWYGGYQKIELAEHIFNLGIGEVANIPLPEDMYALYSRFVQSDTLAPLATRYTGTMGERETNQLVAAHLNAWLDAERFDENRVVSMDGGQNAIEVAIRAFTAPLGSQSSRKQYVLLATPAYPYYSVIVAAHAGLMSFLAYTAEEFTRGVEQYCNPAVSVILINVPHNPMGYAFTTEQVARINRVAEVYDCAVLIDSVYANYPETGEVGRALAGFDPGRTVYVDSFSKKYGLPGLRVGFAVSAEEELTYALRFIKTSESLSPSNGKLAFAGYLLKHHPEVPELIASEIRERRQRFLTRFDPSKVRGVASMGEPHNPFYLTVDVSGICAKAGISDMEVQQHLLDAFQVRVFPGSWTHPSRALRAGMFTGVGRHNPHGPAPYLPPQVPAGEQIVLAPDHLERRTPSLRLSFGAETRAEAAAEALMAGLQSLA
ncbi:MAG TPA: pyridoxal phosphate-dependent aminotransferase [bacterium]|nr:pyridoxal phosphate-dependent aminotransferase [bacterium]